MWLAAPRCRGGVERANRKGLHGRGSWAPVASATLARRPLPADAPAPPGARPPSPGAIIEGEEFWSRVNTGTFEQGLEDQLRAAPEPAWRWGRIGLGLAVGLVFAVVNQYVGLRTGLIVFGSWYVVFMAGLALRWGAADTNLSAVASSGANFIVGGFAYVYPALFLLATGPGAVLAAPSLQVLLAATLGTALMGILGSLGFIALRKAWLVEKPLPYPSFEQYVQLLALTRGDTPLPRLAPRRSAKLLVGSGVAAGAWSFLREFPIGGAPLMRPLEATGYYSSTGLQQPLATAQLTWLTLSLSPLLAAVGWFMRLRIALLVATGAAFAWFLAVPLSVLLGVPAATATGLQGLDVLAAQGQPAALAAFQGPVRALGAGAVVGAGFAALVRMRRLLGPALRESIGLQRHAGGAGDAYEPSPRWAGRSALVALVALPALFLLAGAPLLPALLAAPLVVGGVLLLGAVTVKVEGETSLQPASAAGFLLVMLLVALLLVLGLPPATVALVALLGAAVFFAGITMMGNLLLNMKVGLYVGNTPRHMTRAALLGIVPGALVGGAVAALLGPALASGTLDFAAPQARAYATLVSVGLAAQVPVALVALGALIGAFAEWRTGLGTAFAVGLFLPLGIPAAFVLGALAREVWERRAAARGLVGDALDLARADTYLIATGLMVGEALVGTAAALAVALGAV